MKHQNKEEENRKFKKRITRRDYFNARSAGGKTQRIENTIREKECLSATAAAFKNDKKKRKPDNKKPGQEKFLLAFSFIPETPYDRRDSIPENFRSCSFNEQKQYDEFYKKFIYPYSIPKMLFWTAFEKETVRDTHGRDLPSPDLEIIKLAKKWICDITAGESFYKRNKDYFTRAEAHLFLSTIPNFKSASLIEWYFYIKCLARKMDIKTSRCVARVFNLKFARYYNHSIVIDFLGFIARSTGFTTGRTVLGDICDFVLTKIKELQDGQRSFSFSGRTPGSVISLANEWHANVIREREARYALANAEYRFINRNSIPLSIDRWNGISISHSQFKNDEGIWEFTQLYTVQDLLNEGRNMKNCVSSYASRCAVGDCSIFHVSCIYPNMKNFKIGKATLEISRDRTLVQAKAICNAKIPSATVNIIRKWAQQNRIKSDMLVNY